MESSRLGQQQIWDRSLAAIESELPRGTILGTVSMRFLHCRFP
jgi:hypothetical protein